MIRNPKVIRFVVNLLGFTALGATIYYRQFSDQQRQNIYGAYLSLASSCRSAWIVYSAYKDYQESLNHLEYNSEEYHLARHEVHLRVAKQILALSRQNRGIYLKLGQYLGNLERVVPREFTEVLHVLQDSAPAVPFEEMRVVIEQDLRQDTISVFSGIDPVPLASASLAQVHWGRLLDGREVAVKLQYPFLRIQSKWDLIMLKQLTRLCDYLAKKWKNSNFDFVKLYDEWTATLVEELDFNIQLQHALKTKKLFKDNPQIYIPQYYPELSSDRLIVMEFIDGIKINQRDKLIEAGIDTKKVADNLVDIFTTMIFKYGFVHCDAHPGNILIRKKNNKVGHQIVLLDHGLYRSMRPDTIRNFSGLYLSLLTQQKQQAHEYAQKLNIHEHYEYLPLIFLYRSRNSTKPIGAPITDEERRQFREKDLSNFDSINRILQDLPPQLMYIIRASNLIAAHNVSLGGTNRGRIFKFASQCVGVVHSNWLSYSLHYFWLLVRIWMFESANRIYRLVFGTLQ